MAEIGKWNNVAIADVDKIFGVSKSSLASVYGLTFPATGFYDYTISQSCRFEDGDSAYMHKTPAGAQTPRKIVCFSTWFKRGNLTNVELLSAGSTAADNVIIDIVPNQLRININIASSQKLAYQTTAVFRDPSSWYHIFVAYNTVPASPTIIIVINGRTITSFIESTNIMAQDAEYEIGIDDKHSVGRREYDGIFYMDGYLAETALVIGTEYAATDFGQFVNGVWTPKDISGLTFGTNGFYLDYADSANLGNDVSGGTDLTEVNLAATDQVPDSPTNNFCIFASNYPGSNPVYAEGNLSVTSSNGSTACVVSTHQFTSGLYYAEFKIIGTPQSGWPRVGFVRNNFNAAANEVSVDFGHIRLDTGTVSDFGATTFSAYDSSFSQNDKGMFAVNADTGKWWVGKNGTWLQSGNPAAGTNETGTFTVGDLIAFLSQTYNTAGIVYWNFGQDSTNVSTGNADDNGYGDFEYDVPTGFLALCSANIADPSWMTSPTVNTPEDAFDVVLRTGDAGTPSISSLNFSPDLLWIKNRDQTDSHHLHSSGLTDSDYYIVTDTEADDVQNANSVTSFDANGYTLGTGANGWNDTGEDFVDFAWLESATYGIDILTFEGTGSAHTESHSLGVVPEVMILKNIDGGGNDHFAIYHQNLHVSAPEDNYLIFVSNNVVDDNTIWNDTAPTSSVFTVGTHDAVNASGQTIHAILFASIEGFSKFGSYTGNGDADGPFVYCGFEPQMILVKGLTGAAYDWYFRDSLRSPYNPAKAQTRPSLNAAEVNSYDFDLLSNGFKVRHSSNEVNNSGTVYIYLAFAKFPFKYSNSR